MGNKTKKDKKRTIYKKKKEGKIDKKMEKLERKNINTKKKTNK